MPWSLLLLLLLLLRLLLLLLLPLFFRKVVCPAQRRYVAELELTPPAI